MKKTPIISKISLLLLCLIFTIACNSQQAKNAESTTKTMTNNTVPKVDSILQFSVMITAMLEDSKGNFWFGSHGDGLCRYDGKQYTYFTSERGLPNGNIREFAPGPDWSKTKEINGGNQIWEIQEDEAGNIWIKNGESEICKFNGRFFTTVLPTKKGVISTTKSTTEWKTEFNYSWFGASNKMGLYRYDSNQLDYFNFPPPYAANQRDGVSEIYKDRDGNIWIGTMESGTFRYDGQSFYRVTDEQELGICRAIFQDNTGRVWIGNNRFGLYYMEGDSLFNFAKEYAASPQNEFQTEDLNIGSQTMEQDKNGDLWIGTFSSGLWRYNGKKLTHYTDDNGLPAVTVKTIYRDKRGKLWFGIGEGTVYGFDGASFYRFDD